MDTEWSYYKPNMLSIKGQLILGSGSHSFAPGLSMAIATGATVEIGKNFSCSHNTRFTIFKNLTIGDDNMWSFDNLIMDTDAHFIYDQDGNMVNPNKEIVFGDHVWLGCRNVILKGATVPSGCIVAANSTITSATYSTNSIITSRGEILRESIVWNSSLNI